MPFITQNKFNIIKDKPYTALYLLTPEAVPIVAGTPASPSLNVAEVSGSKFDYTGGSLKYVGDEPVSVDISGSVSITANSGGIIVKMYYGKNGAIDIKTEKIEKILTGSDVITIPINGQFDIIKNNTLDFFIDVSSNATITIELAYWNITTVI